jgi:hypothetical protein
MRGVTRQSVSNWAATFAHDHAPVSLADGPPRRAPAPPDRTDAMAPAIPDEAVAPSARIPGHGLDHAVAPAGVAAGHRLAPFGRHRSAGAPPAQVCLEASALRPGPRPRARPKNAASGGKSGACRGAAWCSPRTRPTGCCSRRCGPAGRCGANAALEPDRRIGQRPVLRAADHPPDRSAAGPSRRQERLDRTRHPCAGGRSHRDGRPTPALARPLGQGQAVAAVAPRPPRPATPRRDHRRPVGPRRICAHAADPHHPGRRSGLEHRRLGGAARDDDRDGRGPAWAAR